jgi:hypothetical protein
MSFLISVLYPVSLAVVFPSFLSCSKGIFMHG